MHNNLFGLTLLKSVVCIECNTSIGIEGSIEDNVHDIYKPHKRIVAKQCNIIQFERK